MINRDFIAKLKDEYGYEYEELRQIWKDGYIWTLYRMYGKEIEFGMILITDKDGFILCSTTAEDVPIIGWFNRMQNVTHEFDYREGCYIPVKRNKTTDYWNGEITINDWTDAARDTWTDYTTSTTYTYPTTTFTVSYDEW